MFRAEHDATCDLARLLSDEDAWIGVGTEGEHPLAMGLHLVLVDEMHDTNRAMFTVLRELMARNRAGFVGVGDRDQVIHAISGADARFMGEAFDREVAVATRMPLSTTWRFGQKLATAVGKLAQKPCVAQRPAGLADTDVELILTTDAADLRFQLRRLITEREGLDAKAPLSGIAILLRQPHQSVELENLLLDHGIDHRTSGFLPYLQRPEVLFVRGLHACARDALGLIERPETREAVLRALLRFSGSRVDTGDLSPEQAEDTALLEKLEKQAIKAICDDPSFAPDFLNNQVLRNAPAAIKPLLEDALDVIDSDDPEAWQRRFVRVLQPQRLAARMMVRKQDIDQVIGNLEGLIRSASGYDHLTSFFRAMNEREMRQHGMPKKHALLLSSIEAAKGLEFDHVILPGLNKGEFALGGHSVGQSQPALRRDDPRAAPPDHPVRCQPPKRLPAGRRSALTRARPLTPHPTQQEKRHHAPTRTHQHGAVLRFRERRPRRARCQLREVRHQARARTPAAQGQHRRQEGLLRLGALQGLQGPHARGQLRADRNPARAPVGQELGRHPPGGRRARPLLHQGARQHLRDHQRRLRLLAAGLQAAREQQDT